MKNKRIKKRRNRWFRWRGVIGTSSIIVFVGLAALSAPMIPEHSRLGCLFNVLAWICFLSGATIRFWATLYVGGRKTETLVTEGPYSISRNPLYLGSFLLLFSAGFFLKSVTFFVGAMLPILAYVFGVVRVEESGLRERFGEQYVQYCRKTPRFLPRISRFSTPPTILMHVSALRIEAKRAAAWIWIPAACEVIAHLRMETWWPHLFRLR